MTLKVLFGFDPALLALLTSGIAAMSAISDHLDALESKIEDATARVLADMAALDAQIVELTAKVDAGGATPEDLARLDALIEKADAIDPKTPSTLPTP